MRKNTEYQNIETEAAEAVEKYLRGDLRDNLLCVNLIYEYDFVWEESSLTGCDFYLVEDGKLKVLHGTGSKYDRVKKFYYFSKNVDDVWEEGAFARLFEWTTGAACVNRLAKIKKSKNAVEVEFRGWKEKICCDKQGDDSDEIFALGKALSAAAEKSLLAPARLFTRKEKDNILNKMPMNNLIAPKFSGEFVKAFDGWTEILAATVMDFLVRRPYMLMLLDEETARVLSLLLSTGFYAWEATETWKNDSWDITSRARYIANKISREELLALCDDFFDLTKIPERAGRFLEFLSKKVGEDLEKTFATPRVEIKVRKAEELRTAIGRPAKIVLLPEIFDELEKGKMTRAEEDALIELAESNPQVFAQYWRLVKRRLTASNIADDSKVATLLNEIWCSLDDPKGMERELCRRLYDIYWAHIGSIKKVRERIERLKTDAESSEKDANFDEALSWIYSLQPEVLEEKNPELTQILDEFVEKIKKFFAENEEKNIAKLNTKFTEFWEKELLYPFETAAVKKFLDGLDEDTDLSKYPPLLLQNAVWSENDAVREKALTICMNDRRFEKTMDYIFHDCFAKGWRGGHEVEAIEMITEYYDFEAEGEYRTRDMLENIAKTCARQKEIPALEELAKKAEDIFEMSEDARKKYIAMAKQAVKDYTARRKNLREELAGVLGE